MSDLDELENKMKDREKVEAVMIRYGNWDKKSYDKFKLEGFRNFVSDIIALINDARNNGHEAGYEEALSVHEVGRKVCSKCKEKIS